MLEIFRMDEERKVNANRFNRRENLFKRNYFITPTPNPRYYPLNSRGSRRPNPTLDPLIFQPVSNSPFVTSFFFFTALSIRSSLHEEASSTPEAPLSRPPSLQKWIKSHHLSLIVGHDRSIAEYSHPQQKWF